MSTFENDLWRRLATEYGAANVEAGPRPRPRARDRRASRVAVGLLAVAGATIALVAIPGASPDPPAYAVTQNADGTVTLTLKEVIAAQAADAQLAKLGVRVVIAKVEPGCRETGEVIPAPERESVDIMGIVEPKKVAVGLEGLRWVIHPAAIPPGDTVRITARLLDGGPIPAVGSSMGLFRGRVAACARPGA